MPPAKCWSACAVRDFEDYCWRDYVTEEMLYIYSAYVRERAVGPRPALLVVHPGAALAPRESEGVVARPCESAFFSTALEGELRRRGAGSLIVCGAPSSGALRATAVEGKSYGYKVVIAEEAVGDFSPSLHALALFDMAHKYADVMSLAEVLEG